MADHMKPEEELYDKREFKRFLGFRLSALVEIAIYFVIMFLIDWIFGSRDRFFYVCPHPFWIIVILIPVQYGIREGLLVAFVASLVLLVGNLPEQTLLMDKFAYTFLILKRPIAWFITAIVLGEIRMRQIRERNELKKIAREAKEKEATILKGYSNLKNVKEQIELTLASSLQTPLMAYNSFKELEQAGKSGIIKGALDLMRTFLAPEKFSIFLLETNQFRCVGYEGWSKEDRFAEKFNASHPLFEKVVGREVVTSVNEEDRRLLSEEGCMAVPIMDAESKTVLGMLKIEQIPFLNWKIATLETLRQIGEWVGTAYFSFLKREEAEANQFLQKDTRLLTPRFFDYQKEFLTNLGKRLNLDITLLTIMLKDPNDYSEERRLQILSAFREAVHARLRAVDQPFDYNRKGHEVSLILINTSREGAEIVRKNIQEELEKSIGKEIIFTYRVASLYGK